MNSFKKRHQRIRDQILYLVELHPDVVSDYRKLVQYYWYYIDGAGSFIPMEVLQTLTKPESITRVFRKLVAEGVVKVPPKIRESRDDEEERFRRHFKDEI